MNNAPQQPISREPSEPTAGRVPAPVWLLIALTLIGFWGFGYLETHGGGFDALVYEPYPSLAYVRLLKPRNADEDRFERGRRLYNDKGCFACHQSSGLGSPSQNWPPLAGSDWVNAEGPNRIIRIVLHGMTGPVEVSGKQFNGGTMTPFANTIPNDAELADLLSYVRSNKEWGNNSGPVTAAQVKAIRDATKDRPLNVPWTEPELKAIPVKD